MFLPYFAFFGNTLWSGLPKTHTLSAWLQRLELLWQCWGKHPYTGLSYPLCRKSAWCISAMIPRLTLGCSLHSWQPVADLPPAIIFTIIKSRLCVPKYQQVSLQVATSLYTLHLLMAGRVMISYIIASRACARAWLGIDFQPWLQGQRQPTAHWQLFKLSVSSEID